MTDDFELWAEGRGGSWWQKTAQGPLDACIALAEEKDGGGLEFSDLGGMYRAEGRLCKWFIYRRHGCGGGEDDAPGPLRTPYAG